MDRASLEVGGVYRSAKTLELRRIIAIVRMPSNSTAPFDSDNVIYEIVNTRRSGKVGICPAGAFAKWAGTRHLAAALEEG